MAELHAGIVVDLTAEELFAYFTDPDRLTQWLAVTARVTPVEGGRMEVEADGRHIDAQILELVQAKRILLAWRIVSPGDRPPVDSRLELAIRRDPAGSRVEVIHWHLPDDFLPRLRQDWAARLARLEAAVDARD